MNNFESESAKRRHWAGVECAMRYHIDHGVWPSDELMAQWRYAVAIALPDDESLLYDFSFPAEATSCINRHLSIARRKLERTKRDIARRKAETLARLNASTMNLYGVRMALGMIPLNPRTIHYFQDAHEFSSLYEKLNGSHGNITMSGNEEVPFKFLTAGRALRLQIVSSD